MRKLILIGVAVAAVLVGGLVYVALDGGSDERRAGALAPRSYAAGNYALELAGANVGALKSFSGCGVSANVAAATTGEARFAEKQVVAVKYGACEIRFGLSMAPAMYQWVTDSLAGKTAAKNVSIVQHDANNQATARLELLNATLTRFAVPELDAANASAVFFEVTLSPEAIQKVKASGALKAAGGSKTAKNLLGSSFRLTIPGVEGNRVSKIGSWSFDIPAPTGGVETKAAAAANLGDLSFLVSDPVPGLDTWLDGLMKGNPTEKDVKIEMLDQTLQTPLFELSFTGAGLIAGDLLGAGTSSTETIPKREFSMYVEGPSLKFTGATP